ncbi:MAG TPA: alpha-L-fucosidase [Bryobacteraceae bacterium]|jgi:alpha-L-fucosidase|nr:alpha-L-fucosidase [Bryobacteraceae bacterium]
MNRRTFHRTILGSVAGSLAGFPASRLFGQEAGHPPAKYEPDWDSIKKHTVPDWYQDAKLGIFIHWGLYSVPAWAPTTGELGKVDFKKWFVENPYAEWYLNSLRITGSPTYQHHRATYGKDFDYYRFAKTFDDETRRWQPEQWATLFRDAGARYAVLTTKHHDGFRLWPSEVDNPHANGRQLSPHRDLVGDLTAAVRGAGLKMGLYYSGGLDWTFTSEPIASIPDLYARIPQTEEYARYADAHWRELIRRYQPAVLWNDIGYPKLGQLPQIFADYYNSVPGGVINNRFSVDFSDFTTPEYANYAKITEKKWESCRGLGFSFGYNRMEGPEQVLSPDKLVALLVDIVSKNGNLLLNIGPRADGSISDIQMDRLRKLGAWMKVNGEGIHGTRPWVRPSAESADGASLRFTRKDDSVYAFFLKRPPDGSLTIPAVYAREETRISALGSAAKIAWAQHGPGLKLTVEGALPETEALCLKLTPAPWQMVRD